MNLTDAEIRIKMAKACGLKFVRAGHIKMPGSQEVWPDHWQDTRGKRKRIDGSIVGIPVALPNYPADLNATHEMEATLEWREFAEYQSNLEKIVQSEWTHQSKFPCHREFATARQRSIAFLKTKGLIP